MIKSAFNVSLGGGLLYDTSFDGLNTYDLSLINAVDLTLSASSVIIQSLTYPSVDGNNGDILTTNGSGTLTFNAPAQAPVTSVNTKTGAVLLSTDNINEGSNNLYYTNTRFDTRLTAKSTSDLSEGINLYYTADRFNANFTLKSTDDLSEGGTNSYYSEDKFNASLLIKTTDNLSEGSTNLYYTDERVDARITASTPGSIDDLSDVDTVTTAPSSNELLKWNGTNWVPTNLGGTANKIAKYTGASTLSVSNITDTGTNVGISQGVPLEKFTVSGGNIALIDTTDRTIYVGEDQNSYIGLKWNVSANKGDIIATHDGSATPLELLVGTTRALYSSNTGAVTFGNNVSVPGTTTMNNRLTIDYSATGGEGTWDKSGLVIRNNNITAAEAAFAVQNVTTGNNYWIHGLNNSTAYNWVYSTSFSATAIKMSLTTTGNLNISGSISEAGTLISNKYLGLNATAADSLLLEGISADSFLRSDEADTMAGTLTMTANITATGTRSVTDFSNYALATGDGNRLSFSGTGSNYAIWMSQSSNATYGGRLDTTSDYNMYFNMSGGNNRGFVFSNNTNPVAQIDSTGILRTEGAIFEAGTQLNAKYLSLLGTAANSTQLGGVAATNFLRNDTDDTFINKISVGNTANRDAGIYGTFDSGKTSQIWSTGIAYSIDAAGAGFGNLIGLAHKHTNNTTGGTMAGGYQTAMIQSGTPTSALGTNVWTSGGFIVEGGTTVQFLKADGSVDSTTYATLDDVAGAGGHVLKNNGTPLDERDGLNFITNGTSVLTDNLTNNDTDFELKFEASVDVDPAAKVDGSVWMYNASTEKTETIASVVFDDLERNPEVNISVDGMLSTILKADYSLTGIRIQADGVNNSGIITFSSTENAGANGGGDIGTVNAISTFNDYVPLAKRYFSNVNDTNIYISGIIGGSLNIYFSFIKGIFSDAFAPEEGTSVESIMLTGDVTGNTTVTGSDVTINTTLANPVNEIDSITLTGSVTGTTAVTNGTPSIATTLTDQLIESISLTGDVTGTINTTGVAAVSIDTTLVNTVDAYTKTESNTKYVKKDVHETSSFYDQCLVFNKYDFVGTTLYSYIEHANAGYYFNHNSDGISTETGSAEIHAGDMYSTNNKVATETWATSNFDDYSSWKVVLNGGPATQYIVNAGESVNFDAGTGITIGTQQGSNGIKFSADFNYVDNYRNWTVKINGSSTVSHTITTTSSVNFSGGDGITITTTQDNSIVFVVDWSDADANHVITPAVAAVVSSTYDWNIGTNGNIYDTVIGTGNVTINVTNSSNGMNGMCRFTTGLSTATNLTLTVGGSSQYVWVDAGTDLNDDLDLNTMYMITYTNSNSTHIFNIASYKQQ